ncbi:MAG: hypothetical protein ACRDUY_13505 [Nitriliruptorales bacterium]
MTLASTVWARALGIHGSSRTSAVSKAWRRLEDENLIEKARVGRLASVALLCEDGSGGPYVHPGEADPPDRYFKIPFPFRTDQDRWYPTHDCASHLRAA